MKKLICIMVLVCTVQIINAQVNLQTGAAEQGFPLINYTDSKAGLSMGVSLAYSSGNGLLVNDLASDVGTGWNLDAGGMISRVQVGEPDDQPENTNGSYAVYLDDGPSAINSVFRIYPNGYMYNPNVGRGCASGLNYLPQWDHPNALYKEKNITSADVEQDKFIFRVNGRTGMFVIPRNWSTTMQATVLGDAKLKINFSVADLKNQGIRTTINQFVITTEDGIKYTFSDKSLSMVCRYKQSQKDASGMWRPGGQYNDNRYAVNYYWGYPADELGAIPYIVNSWHLSKMENPNTGQQITFNYQTVKTDDISSKYISHHRKLGEENGWWQGEGAELGKSWYRYLTNPYYNNGRNANEFSWDVSRLGAIVAGGTTVFFNRAVGVSKRLAQINLANGGEIKFTYNPRERADLKGEHALDEITYFLNSKIIRQYRLMHGYLSYRTIADYNANFYEASKRRLRLCLTGLQKIGTGEDNASEPPYKFTYYMGSYSSEDDIIPPRNFLNQDHWGYYNGANALISIFEDHDYLTQGFDYFKTTLAQFKNPKSGYAKNGLLKEIIYPTGGKLVYSYSQIIPPASMPAFNQSGARSAGGVAVDKTTLTDPEFSNKDVIKTYKYVKPGTNTSSFWGTEAPSYYSFNIVENSLHCGYIVTKGGRNKFKYPGISYPEMAYSVEAGKSLGSILMSSALSIAFNVAIQAVFTGTLVIPILNIAGAVMVIINVIQIIFACGADLDRYDFYLSNVNSAMSNPLPSYFSSVEVSSNSPTGYNGRTVYEFSSPENFPLLVSHQEWPYIQNQRVATWAYGNPRKISVYDQSNNLVSVTDNYYKNIVSALPDYVPSSSGPTQIPANLNCKCATINKEVIRSDDWWSATANWFSWNPIRWMTPQKYKYFTGRTDLTATRQTDYSNGQLYRTNLTQYSSDPATLLQKGKVTYRDANSIVFEINYYPTDYNMPGTAIQKMVDNNMIHIPVSTEKWMQKWQTSTVAGVTTRNHKFYLLSSNVTEFKSYTYGGRIEIKPYKTYQLKTDRPLLYTLIRSFNPATLLRSPQYYKLQSEMIYDNAGNLVETKQNGNITSFVNDYSDRYVTASVINAEPSDIAYSSFETNGHGNWTFNNQGINTTVGLTGNQSFQVNASQSITKSGLSSTASYIATYWVKNGVSSNITVNGQTGALMYETNGWKLYKNIITGSSTATIGGTGIIDELRLYPANALMNTITYKEGIGKIADCDANNRILFYEYDALGRLKLIRDQNRNIIKTYEYNYKQ